MVTDITCLILCLFSWISHHICERLCISHRTLWRYTNVVLLLLLLYRIIIRTGMQLLQLFLLLEVVHLAIPNAYSSTLMRGYILPGRTLDLTDVWDWEILQDVFTEAWNLPWEPQTIVRWLGHTVGCYNRTAAPSLRTDHRRTGGRSCRTFYRTSCSISHSCRTKCLTLFHSLNIIVCNFFNIKFWHSCRNRAVR